VNRIEGEREREREREREMFLIEERRKSGENDLKTQSICLYTLWWTGSPEPVCFK